MWENATFQSQHIQRFSTTHHSPSRSGWNIPPGDLRQ
jgi:hypothetical protein